MGVFFNLMDFLQDLVKHRMLEIHSVNLYRLSFFFVIKIKFKRDTLP